jgi:uncharacterized membrane protein
MLPYKTWLARSLHHEKGKSSNSIGRRLLIYLNWRIEMPRNIYVVLFVLGLIAVVVSVDLLFFKKLFWERLMVNIGIVLVFAAFYLRFLKNP